ncbi:fasciclin domain-containing protein [Mucilaginibacter sabulilitoris]|uniref:Fasciclin domain-containing protein n=1 Tax=Mucilaginibacter sabulilitoris TaxID=1173583 RepID=A0ABZ0TEA7_9SPHI|nr:fasciclin domain-containing protein [Mucilaginibacter sabulilitoris]WPU91526.1 fasciclin domain-containing protein [Mucilaginibacter sabulilitoris]
MKKLIKYMSALKPLLLVILLQSACKKDGGYHNAIDISTKFSGNTYEYLKSKPGVYDSLLAVIDRTGLKQTLADSNVTLFAVTNSSFQLALNNLNTLRRQGDKDPLFLANIDGVQLDTMVSYYIIRGKRTTDSLLLQDGLDLYGVRFGYPMHGRVSKISASGLTGGGPDVIEYSNTKRSKFIRNWATTTTGSNNISTRNGIVHVVSPDHIFGFDEFVSRLTFVPPPPNLMALIGGKLTVLRDNNGGPDNGEGSKKVIDGDDHTKFLADLQGRLWMQFELNEPEVSGVYTLTSANDAPERDPKAWTYEGSNDGKIWTELDRRSNFFFEERYQTKVFRCPNTTAYKFYRVDITELRDGGLFQLAEWTINKVK